ncbi:MAG TPA: outer membrane beta-barrel protein [Candidatus Eisenbacteria bacterium]|jgi:hypothetical protein
MKILLAVGVTIALQVMSDPVLAQPAGSFELGLDGSIAVLTDGHSSVTIVGLPARSARVGYGLTRNAGFQWSLGLDYTFFRQSGATQDTYGNPIQLEPVEETIYAGRAGWTLELHGAAPGPFLRVGPLIQFTRESGTTLGQAAVYAGLGTRLHTAERWAVRLEAGATKFFKTESLVGAWEPAVTVGISYFTRERP